MKFKTILFLLSLLFYSESVLSYYYNHPSLYNYGATYGGMNQGLYRGQPQTCYSNLGARSLGVGTSRKSKIGALKRKIRTHEREISRIESGMDRVAGQLAATLNAEKIKKEIDGQGFKSSDLADDLKDTSKIADSIKDYILNEQDKWRCDEEISATLHLKNHSNSFYIANAFSQLFIAPAYADPIRSLDSESGESADHKLALQQKMQKITEQIKNLQKQQTPKTKKEIKILKLEKEIIELQIKLTKNLSENEKKEIEQQIKKKKALQQRIASSQAVAKIKKAAANLTEEMNIYDSGDKDDEFDDDSEVPGATLGAFARIPQPDISAPTTGTSTANPGQSSTLKCKKADWKNKRYFRNNGKVWKKRFCKEYAKKRDQKSCKLKIKFLELRMKALKKKRDQITRLEQDKVELDLQSDEDYKKTEAGSECISCRMQASNKPTGMQIFGNTLSILAGIGLGDYAAREGRRAQRQANEIRALQGFEAESTNYSLAGLSVAYPFVSRGIYGLTNPNNSYMCSPKASIYR